MDEFKLIKKNIWNRIFKKKICSVYKMFTQIGTEEKSNKFHFLSIVIAWTFGIYSHQTDMLVHKDIKVDEYRGSLFRFFKHPTQIHFSFGGVAISGD